MIDPSLSFQAAIVTKLRATDGIGAVIYDRVPTTVQKPYISFGPSQITSDDATCIDGFEVFQQVDIWSVVPGFAEVKALGEKVRAALHRYEFMVDGVPFEIEHRFTNYLRDSDGLTSHGVLSFRVLIDVKQGE